MNIKLYDAFAVLPRGVQLHTAIGRVVGRRLIGWYRTLAFRNGSVLTTTGFSVYGVLRNETKDHLKDSVHDTLNATLVVDRNNIYIIRQFLGQFTALGPWLKWFCEAGGGGGGSPDEARLEQTPYTFQPH